MQGGWSSVPVCVPAGSERSWLRAADRSVSDAGSGGSSAKPFLRRQDAGAKSRGCFLLGNPRGGPWVADSVGATPMPPADIQVSRAHPLPLWTQPAPGDVEGGEALAPAQVWKADQSVVRHGQLGEIRGARCGQKGSREEWPGGVVSTGEYGGKAK